MKCVRCGAPNAETTWSICADGNRKRRICTDCDIDLNELVMRWAFGDTREDDLEAYRAAQRNQGMEGKADGR